MRCERHEVAAGPDGRCVLCIRREREVARSTGRRRDPARKVAIAVIAIMAAIATFFLTGAFLDTR